MPDLAKAVACEVPENYYSNDNGVLDKVGIIIQHDKTSGKGSQSTTRKSGSRGATSKGLTSKTKMSKKSSEYHKRQKIQQLSKVQ